MNTVLLQYALEVEKTGSITQAAKNLYMDQPNLSKAVKTLEENLGAPIFKRTSKGVVATARGKLFLDYAKSILSQIEEMEAIYKPVRVNGMEFSLSMQRSSYLTYAFARFIRRLGVKEDMNIWLKEANSADVIYDVQSSEYKLGIIRYKEESESYYRQYLEECGLCSRMIMSGSYGLLMSKQHPLAQKRKIVMKDLLPYIEIVCADISDSQHPAEEKKKILNQISHENRGRKIYIYERGSQLNLLSMEPESFMWAAPIPDELMKQYGLVYQSCNGLLQNYVDLLIYRKGYQLGSWDSVFLKELGQVVREIENTSYC